MVPDLPDVADLKRQRVHTSMDVKYALAGTSNVDGGHIATLLTADRYSWIVIFLPLSSSRTTSPRKSLTASINSWGVVTSR